MWYLNYPNLRGRWFEHKCKWLVANYSNQLQTYLHRYSQNHGLSRSTQVWKRNNYLCIMSRNKFSRKVGQHYDDHITWGKKKSKMVKLSTRNVTEILWYMAMASTLSLTSSWNLFLFFLSFFWLWQTVLHFPVHDKGKKWASCTKRTKHWKVWIYMYLPIQSVCCWACHFLPSFTYINLMIKTKSITTCTWSRQGEIYACSNNVKDITENLELSQPSHLYPCDHG